MKYSSILFTALACGTIVSLHSCLDFDNPGDELSTNQVTTDTQIHQGLADSLDYKRVITVEEAQAAMNELEIPLSQCKTGVYNMRGGKEGGVPASHSYQYQYNLDTDGYAQYFVVTHKDFPYANKTLTSTYNMGFNGAGHSGYGLAKKAFAPFLNNPKATDIPEIKAIYLLYFNLIAQENADLSGPFTYTEDKSNSENPQTYEPLKDIYYSIEANIDSCLNCWKYYDENREEDYKQVIVNYLDMLESDGNANWNYGLYYEYPELSRFDNFKRLANSLKLRMAMHMVKVEPETAKKWAEEAVADGVIETAPQQQGVFPTTIGFTHPLVEIVTSWNDSRISASFESLLMSLDHPYTKYLFTKNSHDITNLGSVIPTEDRKGEVTEANSKIVGIRSGEFVGEGQAVGANPFVAYSSIDKEAIGTSPLYFISLAEVCFLRAEGAIRGWDMKGDASEFYEKGIRNAYIEDPSYLENGWLTTPTNYTDYVEDYLQLAHPIDYVQVEPQGLGPDWPSATKIGVTWNEGDDLETKLEKIITQKYIALFPNSHEAWNDLRRTGYPRLFPVLHPEDGDGTIGRGGAENIIRRIPWQETDPAKQGLVIKTGIPALGGQDDQATRIWWDVNAPNF